MSLSPSSTNSMNELKRFHEDVHARDAVYTFLLETLDKKALEAVWQRRETVGFAEARATIISAFAELSERFDIPK